MLLFQLQEMKNLRIGQRHGECACGISWENELGKEVGGKICWGRELGKEVWGRDLTY